ncbi:alpha-N-acetylneuraminide alpha-2,8-sialyltransferase-like [Ptychodera flava]|uniref:alpha-N-acetylneuraminide alpha-2,8-sialyltransferase-like n=1 Tax=Ptychodera flava TaxID=63121 RepID=UPI00396A31AC
MLKTFVSSGGNCGHLLRNFTRRAFRKQLVALVLICLTIGVSFVNFADKPIEYSYHTSKRPFLTDEATTPLNSYHAGLNRDGENSSAAELSNVSLNGTNEAEVRSVQNTTSEITRIFNSIKPDWKLNMTAAESFRSVFEAISDPSKLFLASRNSVRLNETLRYSGERASLNISPEIHNRFPEEGPFKKSSFRRCSIVASSGILLRSNCGRSIDSSDFVIRFNLAGVRNYSGDVGEKTNLVTCNPSIIRDRYGSLGDNNKRRRFKKDLMAEYGNATVYVSAFTHRFCTKLAFKAQDALKENTSVVFGHPRYFVSVQKIWKDWGVDAMHLSSGAVLLPGIFHFCQEVHLYGYWPFSEDNDGNPVQYHYFDANAVMQSAQKIKQNYHNMPSEFQQIVDLHNAGVLQLHVGKCSS